MGGRNDSVFVAGVWFIRLPEAYSTGSSAMPQKKNPDPLELIRGKAARVIGDATALLVTVKGLPLAYNKDLQETQQPLLRCRRCCLSLPPLAAGFMKAMEFNRQRMQQAAESGFMNAWAGATYLVQRESLSPGPRNYWQSRANQHRKKL